MKGQHWLNLFVFHWSSDPSLIIINFFGKRVVIHHKIFCKQIFTYPKFRPALKRKVGLVGKGENHNKIHKKREQKCASMHKLWMCREKFLRFPTFSPFQIGAQSLATTNPFHPHICLCFTLLSYYYTFTPYSSPYYPVEKTLPQRSKYRHSWMHV